MDYIANAVGLLGVILCLFAYGFARKGKMSAYGCSFLVLNTCASAMIIFSLCYSFNLAAFILEIAWLMVSVSSLLKISVKKS